MLRERKAVKKNNSIINNCPNNLSELLKLSAEVFMRFYKNFYLLKFLTSFYGISYYFCETLTEVAVRGKMC